MESIELIEQNGKVYSATTNELDSTFDQVAKILKKVEGERNKEVSHLVKFQSWDKQAKRIDRFALLLMPMLFSVVTVVYWTTFLCLG